MPIYEYQCPECGHVFEEWVNIKNASAEAPCPQCGGQAMHIISNTAFVLKGGGWYATDYGTHKNDGHKEAQDSAAPSVSPTAVTSATPDSASAATPPVSTDTAPAKASTPAKKTAATPAASSAASA